MKKKSEMPDSLTPVPTTGYVVLVPLNYGFPEQRAEIDKNWQAGNVSAALITLKNAVRVQPDDAALRRRLAEFYIRLGNPEAAQAEIEKASPEYRHAAEKAGYKGREADQVGAAAEKLCRGTGEC